MPDAIAFDRLWRCSRAHQHVRQRGGLRRRIPAIEIERRIGFGDALRLHARERGVEVLAMLDRGQDVIGRAVDDAAEAEDLRAPAASPARG